MAKTSPVQRLRALNRLLSEIYPSDPEQTKEIRKAVEFYIDELNDIKSEDKQLVGFAEDILNIHFQGGSEDTLCFWSIDPEERELLWLRSSFLEKLNTLKKHRFATVVIFGLQDSISRNNKYWTQKNQNEYNEFRDYLEQVAAEWQPAGCRLNMIYM